MEGRASPLVVGQPQRRPLVLDGCVEVRRSAGDAGPLGQRARQHSQVFRLLGALGAAVHRTPGQLDGLVEVGRRPAQFEPVTEPAGQCLQGLSVLRAARRSQSE